MADLELSLACWDYDRTRALADGRVKPAGIALRYLPIGMPESFFRMLRYGEFSISEMSLSWYARTVFLDPRPFMAIPVFPSRMFRHGCIFINADSGIREPKDLVGRRVGLPEYQITAAVWLKGILADHHDVPVNSVTYYTGGLKQPGRTETPMSLPDDIRIVPIGDRRTLGEMLEAGEIDALYTAEPPVEFVRGSERIRRLFADFEEVERAYLESTGIFPIMHTIVIRWDVYQRDPWVARSLTDAFVAAQRLAYEDLDEIVALKTMLPWLPAHVESTRALFGTSDYWPYGLERNRETLRTFLRYSHEQGLTPRQLEPEELFAPELLQASKI
jgi:4,5-dihydroxyphthalate decarboxylase